MARLVFEGTLTEIQNEICQFAESLGYLKPEDEPVEDEPVERVEPPDVKVDRVVKLRSCHFCGEAFQKLGLHVRYCVKNPDRQASSMEKVWANRNKLKYADK